MRALITTLVVVALLSSWILALTLETFSAHMVAHVLAVAIAAPILALIGMVPRRLAAPGIALAACGVELVVVWTWHLPRLHNAAAGNAAWFCLEQLMFLAAGLAVWAGIRPGPGASDNGVLVTAAVLLVTSMHMTLLGALLIVAPEPLYGLVAHTHELADQHLGGLVMLAVAGPAYLAGAVLSLGATLWRRSIASGVAP